MNPSPPKRATPIFFWNGMRRVVASYDEVSATIIATNQCMKECFTRAGITHRCREYAQYGPILRIEVVDHRLVRRKNCLGRIVTSLFSSDERLNEQSIRYFQGQSLKIFVSSVRNVPRLETSDRF